MEDNIVRTIAIDAPIETVWELVSEPGWWINTGTLTAHRLEDDGEGRVIVHDDALGAFPLGIEVLEPPHRAVFTWLAGEQGTDVPRTRTEFLLDEVGDGSVLLTVTESGFATMDPEAHARIYPENSSGWEQEIALAKAALEQHPGA